MAKHPSTHLNCDLNTLIDTVQHNCHIADAQNALDNPMCIYLMKMREYFRWAHKLPLTANLPKDQLGKWINEREKYWGTIVDQDFSPLCIDREHYSPFALDEINDALLENGLCYCAGYGRGGQVHFHLGQHITHPLGRDQSIYISDQEYARDLTAPPAHTVNGKVFVRKDALKRYIWSKVEEWTWRRPDNAMGRCMEFYDFENNTEKALAQMTEHEMQVLILHEQGEQRAGELLGPEWESFLLAVQGTKNEVLCRGVRDHLADSLVTLPWLIENESWASIHFYFANLEGFRKLLWPELVELYKSKYASSGFLEKLEQAINSSEWLAHTENLISFFDDEKDKLDEEIKKYFKSHFVL